MLLLLALAACRHTPPAEPVEAIELAEAGDFEPRAVLQEGAADLDVSVRSRALVALIRHTPEAGGGAWGARALYDPNPAVQRAGLRALVPRLAEPESRALLIGVVSRTGVDPYVRGAAAVELALHGDRSTLPALQESLAGRLAPWHAAPLALGAAMMGDEAAISVLAAALERGDLPLELGFFSDLGRSGLPQLAPALEVAANRVEEELVVPVGCALLGLGVRKGEALIHAGLAGGEEQALETLDALAVMDLPVAGELIAGATSGGPDSARTYARLILVGRGEGDPGFALDALAHADREVRQQAVAALARRVALERGRGQPLPRAGDALVAALDDPETVVALEALDALALAGRPEDLAPLVAHTGDRALAWRVATAAAILDIRSRQAALSPGS